MAARTKLRRAWQAGGLKELPQGHPVAPLWSWWYTPAGSVDVTTVGDGSGNSAVEACLQVKTGAFAEAPLTAFLQGDDQEETLPGHPAVQLVNRPNPYMVGELLWQYTIAACDIAGDAYWLKVRSAGGRPVEIWPLLPQFVEPRDATGSLATPEERQLHQVGQGPFIAYYEYKPQGMPLRLETSEVIHLRTGLDPENHRKGKAPLKTVLREIVGDEEAGQFSTSLLTNMGVPAVVVSPDDPNDEGPSPEEAEAMAELWDDKFGGSNRGKPWIPTHKMKVQVVSLSPEQMKFDMLREVPEERISAVLGVPAILAGLGAGLKRGTYSNARELREFFTESKLTPLWRIYGTQLSYQLLPDFSTAPALRLGFDLKTVRALQEDEDARFRRWLEAVKTGAATVADFRRAVGLDYTDADEVYLRPVNLLAEPAGEEREPGVPTPRELEALVAGS